MQQARRQELEGIMRQKEADLMEVLKGMSAPVQTRARARTRRTCARTGHLRNSFKNHDKDEGGCHVGYLDKRTSAYFFMHYVDLYVPFANETTVSQAYFIGRPNLCPMVYDR